MRTLTVPSNELDQLGRLDAYFHLSEGHRLAQSAKRRTIPHLRLGSAEGINANVWAPARFKRVYAAEGETNLPYLRPSDTLNYMPLAADLLSAVRSENIHDYALRVGMILITCSGRNLGPVVYVDEYLAHFVLSHDMVRVEITDERMRLYVLALLGTASGQQLLRKDKSGSVIDHITVQHVASVNIPMLSDHCVSTVATQMKAAVGLRERARLALKDVSAQYEAMLPPLPTTTRGQRLGWTTGSQNLQGRLDAAPYDPSLHEIRQSLTKAGGVPLGEVAVALKPAGRYKTVYVEQEHGIPILSGGQLLQIRPLSPKYIAPHALADVDRYRLTPRWIAYQADGRSEEALGEPVMVTENRRDWLASGHIGRLVAKEDVSPGSLFLAFQTPHAQRQLKALASGSVVDATFPRDAESIVLPPLSASMGALVDDAWAQLEEAQVMEDATFAIIEEQLHTPLTC